MKFSLVDPERILSTLLLGLLLLGGCGGSSYGSNYNYGNSTTYNLTINDPDMWCNVTVNGTEHGAPNDLILAEPAQSTVGLAATPISSAYTFGAWTGTTNNDSPSTAVVMDSDKSVTVACPAALAGPFTLTLSNPDGHCNMTVNGTAYSAPLSESSGTLVTLGVTPAQGYSFGGWDGDITSSASSLQITMNANKTITATCPVQPSTYTLTIKNYLAWCSATSSNATLSGSTAATITASVPIASPTVDLHGAPLTYFHWVMSGENGGWYGPIDGGSANLKNQDVTVTLAGDTTIGVCCPATATDCPAAGAFP
jgi:hypothetical protein